MFRQQEQPNWPRSPRKYRKYAFRDLAVGDTLSVPVDECGCKDLNSFRALVWNTAKRLEMELSCREQDGMFEVYRSK